MPFRPGASRPDVRPQAVADDRVQVIRPGESGYPASVRPSQLEAQVIDRRRLLIYDAQQSPVAEAYSRLITDIQEAGVIKGSQANFTSEQVANWVDDFWHGRPTDIEFGQLTDGGWLAIRERLEILLQRRAQEAAQQGRGGRQGQRRGAPQPQVRRPEAEAVANPDAWRADLNAALENVLESWKKHLTADQVRQIRKTWYESYQRDPGSGGLSLPNGLDPKLSNYLTGLWLQLSNRNDQRLGRQWQP